MNNLSPCRVPEGTTATTVEASSCSVGENITSNELFPDSAVQKNATATHGAPFSLRDIISRGRQIRRAASRFDRREPRVSAIGYCARAQVAYAIGRIERTPIAYEYQQAGYLLQHELFLDIQAVYPDAEEEVAVESPVSGVMCHPDIAIPSQGICIQVKTRSASATDWSGIRGPEKAQVLLEWFSWRFSAGHTQDGKILLIIPKWYFLAFIDRDSYGRVWDFKRVAYDPPRAEKLARRFREIADCIALEILPPRPATKCGECFECELRKECWE